MLRLSGQVVSQECFPAHRTSSVLSILYYNRCGASLASRVGTIGKRHWRHRTILEAVPAYRTFCFAGSFISHHPMQPELFKQNTVLIDPLRRCSPRCNAVLSTTKLHATFGHSPFVDASSLESRVVKVAIMF